VGESPRPGEDDVAQQRRTRLTQVLCALLAGDPPGLPLPDDCGTPTRRRWR
jgi:hypothetical protein